MSVLPTSVKNYLRGNLLRQTSLISEIFAFNTSLFVEVHLSLNSYHWTKISSSNLNYLAVFYEFKIEYGT